MTNSGLIYAHILSGKNKGAAINANQLDPSLHTDECTWLHFDYTHPDTEKWFNQQSQLDPTVSEALLNEETRPRASIINHGVLISLRGVNLSPDSNPEDMVAIRIWIEGNRIISTRHRRLISAGEMATLIKSGEGPESPGEFVTMLASKLITRMQNTIQEIEDKVDDIEERSIDSDAYSLRKEIANLRRQTISLRRYLAPQREAMMQLQNENIALFSTDDRIRLRETTDHLVRYIEELDTARDHAAVTQEELANRLSEQLNNRMYVLSIAAAIFLPLGFFTGLLGINVGGIPGADNPYAFLIFVTFLSVTVALQIWLFKSKRWF